jgi:hypothetical protein
VGCFALTCCCGLSVVTRSCLCTLSCESISILIIIGDFSSSSTSVAVTGSTYGEGIASTLTIPSLCAISYASSMVSCGDLRLLWVLHVFWLGAPTFGGAIMETYFFLYLSFGFFKSLYSPVRLLSLASRVFNFTISLICPAFLLYIEGVIISLNRLRRIFFIYY